MITPTANFTTKAETQGNSPIVLVEFLGNNEQFGTRAVSFTVQWKCGEGAISGSGLKCGATHGSFEDRLLPLTDGGLTPISYGLQENGIGRFVGNVNAGLANADLYSTKLQGIQFVNRDVRILLGFVGLEYADYIPLFRGIVQTVDYSYTSLRFGMVERGVRIHRSLGVPVGSQYFPGTPLFNRGKLIPILLGAVFDAEAIQVTGNANGSLAFDIAGAATELFLNEYGAPFHAEGSIAVGSETDIAYTERNLVNLRGTTYLRLGGLTGVSSSHSASEQVVLHTIDFDYLIGYQINSIVVVRRGGLILTADQYTFTEVDDTSADRNVSRLTINPPSELATPGAITVTPQGAAGGTTYTYRLVAVDETTITAAGTAGSTATGNATLDGTNFNRLTWTAVAGATGYQIYRTVGGNSLGRIATISDGTVATFDDQGQVGDGAPAPEVAIISPYDNITVDVNGPQVNLNERLTNGGWEVGDNSSWTLSGATDNVVTTDPVEGDYEIELTSSGGDGVYGDNYQEVTTVVGERYTMEVYYKDEIPGSNIITDGGFDAADLSAWTIAFVDPAHGSVDPGQVYLGQYAGYTALVAEFGNMWPGQNFDRPGPVFNSAGATANRYYWSAYAIEVSQEFTTTIGIDYRWLFRFQTGHAFYGPALMLTHGSNRITLRWGTAASPTLFYEREGMIYSLPPGLGGVAEDLWGKESGTFQATTTSTRVAFRMYGSGSSLNYYMKLLSHIDLVHCEVGVDVPAQSRSAIYIGTSGDPDSLLDEELPQSLQWSQARRTFVATETTTRLTLRTKWLLSSTPSHFDAASISQIYTPKLGGGGENPVELIEYIITTFLPQIKIHRASFDAAYDKLSEYRFGGYIPRPGASRQLLNAIASQCRSRLIENGDGELRFIVIDDTDSAVFAFDNDNIIDDSLVPSLSPIANVATEFYVWFGRKSAAGGATNPEDFQGVTYANPTETTHTAEPLDVLCTEAALSFLTTQRIDIFAEYIKDFNTANKLLEFEVKRGVQQRQLVTLQGNYESSKLEIGDLVHVTSSLIAIDPLDPLPFVYRILKIDALSSPSRNTFRMEKVRLASYEEPWEYSKFFAENTRVTETWES